MALGNKESPIDDRPGRFRIEIVMIFRGGRSFWGPGNRPSRTVSAAQSVMLQPITASSGNYVLLCFSLLCLVVTIMGLLAKW